MVKKGAYRSLICVLLSSKAVFAISASGNFNTAEQVLGSSGSAELHVRTHEYKTKEHIHADGFYFAAERKEIAEYLFDVVRGIGLLQVLDEDARYQRFLSRLSIFRSCRICFRH
jgi:hypothetical protein